MCIDLPIIIFFYFLPFYLFCCLQFKQKLQSVAVEGTDIIAAAREACQKSMAKLEAREAAAKAAAKREEERVTELRKARGERWLPCMAKDRLVGFQGT